MGTITVKEDYARVIINITQAGDCNNCHGNGEVSYSSCLGMGGMSYSIYYSGCIWVEEKASSLVEYAKVQV